MTFDQIVTDVVERFGRASSQSARIGRNVNARYKRLTSSLGIKSREVFDISGNTAIGSKLVTFSGIEQVRRVVDARNLTSPKVLDEVTLDELRNDNPAASDTPTRWAVYRVGASSVTILLDAVAQTVYALLADGLENATTLSGSTVPAFPESFHDILVEGAAADELKKDEKFRPAEDAEAIVRRRTSELRLHLATSPGLTRRQGQREAISTTTGGGGGSAVAGGQSYTQTGLITFHRGSGAVPFAISDTDAAYVPNLFVEGVGNLATDKLVGRDTVGTGESEAIGLDSTLEFTGSQSIRRAALTGDVTASAGSNATTIAADSVTYAKMQNVSAASKVLGRGSAGGAGDPQEITLGSTLTMSGTTLSVTSPPTLGSWTPVIGGSGGTSGQTYATQVGRYIKIGQLVHVQAYVTLTAKGTITGSVQIQGLPFTSLNVANAFSTGHVEWFSLATNWNYISAEVQVNSTAATLLGVTAAAAGVSALATGDIGNASQFLVQMSYIADS